MIKSLPDLGSSLRGEDLLEEEGMATHSSVVAWKIPQSEDPGGPESTGVANRGMLCGADVSDAKRFQSVRDWVLKGR